MTQFVLHPSLDPSNYKITPSMRNTSLWKAKILAGNSARVDQDVGEWDDVGYIMISMKDNTIIPIARGDEHHEGHDLLYDMKDINPHDFVPVYGLGSNYAPTEMQGSRAVEKFVLALKKYLSYGGKDTVVEFFDRTSSPVLMSEYIEMGGAVNTYNYDEISAPTQKLLNYLVDIAKMIRQTDEMDVRRVNLVRREISKMLRYFYNNRSYFYLFDVRYQDIDAFLKDSKEYSLHELERNIYGFEGLAFKNKLHNSIRNFPEYQKSSQKYGNLDKINGILSSI